MDGGWSILEKWESVSRCCQRDRLQKDNMQSSFDQFSVLSAACNRNLTYIGLINKKTYCLM